MKKSILFLTIAVVITVGYSFGTSEWSSFVSENESTESTYSGCKPYATVLDDKLENKVEEFVYEIEPRFKNTITMENLVNASTAYDIIPEASLKEKGSVVTAQFRFFNEHEHCMSLNMAQNNNEQINDAQKTFIKGLDYTTSFIFSGNTWRYPTASQTELDTFVYYMTVVPHQQAKYKRGEEELIEYFKTYSTDVVAELDVRRLKPGTVNFTITKEGEIHNPLIINTCGYRHIDVRMIRLVESIPGEWEPAEDASGNKVDQRLTFFFGKMGC